MTEYVKKTFEHAWQAAKFVQEGGKLFTLELRDGEQDYIDVVSQSDACLAFRMFRDSIYTIKPTDWRDQLDGTVENGVLCWVSDIHEIPSKSWNESIRMVTTDCLVFYRDDYKERWQFATPLTRAEIAKLMENAPE